VPDVVVSEPFGRFIGFFWQVGLRIGQSSTPHAPETSYCFARNSNSQISKNGQWRALPCRGRVVQRHPCHTLSNQNYRSGSEGA
jgi:hypothetical protein